MESNQVPNEVSAFKALVAVNYKTADLNTITQSCNALDVQQKAKLLAVPKQHESLFQGKRGNWKGQPVSIEVIDGAVPVWSKPYPIPLKNRDTFKEEVYRQCNIGALRELSVSEVESREWASPCFGVPKRDGSIRLVMDFRKLNSVLKRKEYPLPTIKEMFQNIGGFIFASTIDLNMGYLSIPLTAKTKELLTIVTQFGFFECCVLPMGVRLATDIFQSRMVGIFMSWKPTNPIHTSMTFSMERVATLTVIWTS
jgi:hypothetical protein